MDVRGVGGCEHVTQIIGAAVAAAPAAELAKQQAIMRNVMGVGPSEEGLELSGDGGAIEQAAQLGGVFGHQGRIMIHVAGEEIAAFAFPLVDGDAHEPGAELLGGSKMRDGFGVVETVGATARSAPEIGSGGSGEHQRGGGGAGNQTDNMQHDGPSVKCIIASPGHARD